MMLLSLASLIRLAILWLSSITCEVAAAGRFFSGSFPPFPNCNAHFNAPCSSANVQKVVLKAKAALEATTNTA
jgi:hypothetical protein